ncbi:MAG: AhpC/TSA family protein [Bacteroidaceae bacterium]|nr:AhpC/TSA family protein [Bacteroidaceae bacterium]
MLHKILSTIILAFLCVAANAQGICVINGNIADDRLADGKKIKKLVLTRTDEFGRTVEVATAKVKKGAYTFKYELSKGEPVLQYVVTGFGDGKGVGLFVEPGEVTVNTPSVAAVEQSTVAGTPANDAYAQYKAIYAAGLNEVATQVAALEARNGKEWMESAEGKAAIKRIEAKEAVRTESNALRFLIEHNASPMTPLVIENSLLPKLTTAYADQMVKTIHADLQEHPYFLSLRNKVLSNDMKVGNELPDVTLPLSSGEVKHLSDYRGKYVVLNFWANGCAESERMLAEMKNLYEVVKENQDQFVIISFALESDAAAWKAALESKGMNVEGWLNVCDLAGSASPAAKLLGVEKTPRIILVEQEGRAVSLDMDIDEVVMRVEQILSGDLYYFDQAEYK